jgi:peptide/nickel transport system substrate-binding protein
MAKKLLFSLLIMMVVLLPLLGACAKPTPTTPTTPTPTKAPTQASTQTPTKTPTTTPTSAPTTKEAKWWDKFGEPQYGGAITYRVGSISPQWDTAVFPEADYQLYFECLWVRDWTLDRNICSFQGFIPNEYHVGALAESWEWTNPQTLTVHIRKGIHWQDKPPVNGREFTAYDVQKHYDRMLGTGSGYTEPNPQYMSFTGIWEKVTATDDYTAVIEFKHPSALGFANLLFPIPLNRIEAPEAVEAEGGALTDWRKAVGTGPWMLEDYVTGTSLTYSRNPDYWGYDLRHPENKLPYADELKILIIPDLATAIAALRTGKVDIMGGNAAMLLPWEQAQSLKRTNPELVIEKQISGAVGLSLRLDRKPFTDIRVRKALQMAINRKEIAAQYYHGDVDGIPAGVFHPSMKGYCYAYDDWPQELKDEYSYNPTRAKELLAEAGYPDGFHTNAITSGNTDPVLLQIFKSYFKDIGVDMDIELMDQGGFLAKACSGQFDQTAWWGTSKAELWAYSDWVPGAHMNFVQANDPTYNELANNIEYAADTAELRKWTVELDKYFLSQHWVIPAVPFVGYTAWQPYLKGYSCERLNSTLDHIFMGCWIDQDLKKSMGR